MYVGNLSYDVKYRDLIEFMRGGGLGRFSSRSLLAFLDVVVVAERRRLSRSEWWWPPGGKKVRGWSRGRNEDAEAWNELGRSHPMGI